MEPIRSSATVRTPFGPVITAPSSLRMARGRATLSIRPEKLNLGDQVQGVGFQADVVNKHYLGGYTHYQLAVGGVEIRASRRNASRDGDAIAVGSSVHVGFVESAARVLAA